jgi:hypothetical protein
VLLVKGRFVAYSPTHYLENKEKYAAKSKAWREQNPEKAAALRKKNYEANKERDKDYSTFYNRKRKYGITKEEYIVRLESQQGVCAICGLTCTRALAVDHNHLTGKVRGLLCNNCNRGIGHLKDSTLLLEKAIKYLKETN